MILSLGLKSTEKQVFLDSPPTDVGGESHLPHLRAMVLWVVRASEGLKKRILSQLPQLSLATPASNKRILNQPAEQGFSREDILRLHSAYAFPGGHGA